MTIAVLIYDAEEPYRTYTPEQWAEVFAAHQRFAAHAAEQGAKVLASKALQPTPTAHSVRGDAVTDGPFVPAEQAFCGYYLIEADDLDQALEIAKLCPAAYGGVEVRPVGETPSR